MVKKFILYVFLNDIYMQIRIFNFGKSYDLYILIIFINVYNVKLRFLCI